MFNPWVRKNPWRRKWQPTSVFLPGKSHRERSLVGYSLWGHKRVGHDLVTKQYQESKILQLHVAWPKKKPQNTIHSIKKFKQIRTLNNKAQVGFPSDNIPCVAHRSQENNKYKIPWGEDNGSSIFINSTFPRLCLMLFFSWLILISVFSL